MLHATRTRIIHACELIIDIKSGKLNTFWIWAILRLTHEN